MAEFVRVSEGSIRPRPARLTAEEAAAVPLAGITALWAMRDAGAVQPGQHVLVNGASGGVGTFAVQIASGPPFDLMLDNVGNHAPTACLRVVKRGGTYVASFDHPWNRWLGPMGRVLRMSMQARLAGKLMVLRQPERRDTDLDTLTELIDAGAVTPVVDRTFPLVDTRQAIEYLAGRHARGKVVITP